MPVHHPVKTALASSSRAIRNLPSVASQRVVGSYTYCTHGMLQQCIHLFCKRLYFRARLTRRLKNNTELYFSQMSPPQRKDVPQQIGSLRDTFLAYNPCRTRSKQHGSNGRWSETARGSDVGTECLFTVDLSTVRCSNLHARSKIGVQSATSEEVSNSLGISFDRHTAGRHVSSSLDGTPRCMALLLTRGRLVLRRCVELHCARDQDTNSCHWIFRPLTSSCFFPPPSTVTDHHVTSRVTNTCHTFFPRFLGPHHGDPPQ